MSRSPLAQIARGLRSDRSKPAEKGLSPRARWRLPTFPRELPRADAVDHRGREPGLALEPALELVDEIELEDVVAG